MRICVYGAGAIGGQLAARLAEGGADVSVIVRGANLVAIRSRGLRIVTPGGEITSRPRATDDPATLGPQDAVLVTTKAQSLGSVAAGIAPLLGPDTPVVFVLNGIPWWYFHAHGGPSDGRQLPVLDPGGKLRETIGPGRVIGGVVYAASEMLEPGVVEVENPNPRLVLGEPDGTMSERVEAIAAPLRAGGVTVDTTDRIRDAIWTKLLGNISSGPVAVLTQSAPKDFHLEPQCTATMMALHAEGQNIARALGCTPKVNMARHMETARAMGHKPSILQDLLLGRPMEIDGLYSTPLELARMAGVATPTLDLMVALVKVRARAAGLYDG